MELDTIQWFPGHMVKARKMVQENLKLVDIVVELLDARIPLSSRNPDIDSILEKKPRIVVLNKADLANDSQTEQWSRWFREGNGLQCVALDSQQGKGIGRLIGLGQELAVQINKKLATKGRKPRAVRMMMVGIPNVGKSSLINKLAGKGYTRTGDRPGLTRGKQWIRVGRGLELLDTPGILWPKFEDPEVGFRLAVTGAIKDEIINIEQITVKLINFLTAASPDTLINRYKLGEVGPDPYETLRLIGAKRGCLVSGGNVDTFKAAVIVLNEFRGGKLGRFTLDTIESDA
ncbi:ribosome biogenesis GTPase YlqF [Phosphitispora fastidiosa]|uniref:ribosome biogenesis GTPase YlqF n=1 Tax=Phosphitispora fastidiosa TaxID=2837202 RepID=UPI001E3D5DFE|nr:ribosome biogenesis GTPase YlqF [Phosphitispora fastidiosa]MBU7005452.1 ribosome biogenesis GTPase A [Phosphitispora fastidiosa]